MLSYLENQSSNSPKSNPVMKSRLSNNNLERITFESNLRLNEKSRKSLFSPESRREITK